jgi:K+-sensing histidine kinase KdpD
VPSSARTNLLRTAAVLGLVASIVFFYARILRVNPTTVALTFLAAVLIVSAFWPRNFAVAFAVLSTLAYNFFFLPPLHTFVISEGQNWVALIVFLLTALVATHLAERARQSAEQLARLEAARENARLRAALLDSVAHSFRTPLTSIKASVTGLLSAVQYDAGQRNELLTIIDEETDRLDRIVGEAARMAQLDAGMMTLEISECSVQNVIESALDATRGLLSVGRVTVDLGANLPRVRIDARRISAVLAQLLENAAKFSAPASSITIRGQHIGRHVKLSVSDHGPGIAPEEQSRIFEKFYRGIQHRESIPGTGMGLAICKVIVEEHGGAITVASTPGQGSTFSFTVPTAESVR